MNQWRPLFFEKKNSVPKNSFLAKMADKIAFPKKYSESWEKVLVSTGGSRCSPILGIKMLN